MPHIHTKSFNRVCISINTNRKEAYMLCTHGRAPTNKPLTAKYNNVAQLMWYKAFAVYRTAFKIASHK